MTFANLMLFPDICCSVGDQKYVLSGRHKMSRGAGPSNPPPYLTRVTQETQLAGGGCRGNRKVSVNHVRFVMPYLPGLSR